ncbi:reverse transcriptase domain-containing protein [Tanacetum coccineum]
MTLNMKTLPVKLDIARFCKMFKQLRLEIGLKDALIEMPKFNKCSRELEDPGKFLIPCALQELDWTNALADSGASINLLPHSIYKQLGLGALTPTRMTLELANRSITHPMGIAEDVVVRVDGFTFLADFVVVNFEPDPRVPIILGRPFLRTAKALIDLYEEKLTLRVGSDELVFYAEKSEKSKNKQFAHAISVIDFLKDEPFSGSTTNDSNALPPSSSPVKTSDNLEEFADELTLLKKDVHFQVYSNPLFEFDDNFTSSNDKNPLFKRDWMKMSGNKNSNLWKYLLFEEDIRLRVSGDVIFLENLLSDDTTHNLAPEVISDHEPNESIHNTSITFSPRSDLLHHEFAGELITLPSRIVREHEDYLNQPFVNPPLVPMADNRTMAQLLQAPTEGYEDAIVIPKINANFELKHGLINLVQNKQFFGHDKEDPHAHIRYFNKITSTMRFPDIPSTSIKLMLFPFSLEGSARIWLEKEPPRSILTWDDLVSKFINQFFPPSKMTNLRNEITRFQQRFDESFYEAWDRFNDLLRACPHHGFSELHQLDTFYNALNANDQDSLNSALGRWKLFG